MQILCFSAFELLQQRVNLFKFSNVGIFPIYFQIMNDTLNKKFTTLRNKLDDLNLTQILHPDSIPLVQNLLNLYMKVSIAYQNSKKTIASQSMIQTNNSYSKGTISNNTSCLSKNDDQSSLNQHKMDLLLKQLNQTQKKLEQKEQQLELLKDGSDSHGRIKEVRDKYDNKIDDCLRQIQKFERREKIAQQQKRDVEQTITNLNKQLDTLRDELQSKQKLLLNETKERIAIRRQYDSIMNISESQDNRKVQEINSILERKKTQIEELQQQISVSRSKLLQATKKLQLCEIEQKQFIIQNKNLNLIIDSLKVQNSDLERTNSRYKINIQQLNQELDASKKYKNSLQQKLQNIEVEQIEKNFTIQVKDKAKDKLTELYDNSQKALIEKKNECDILEGERDQLQKETQRLQTKVKQLSNKNAILNNNINTLQEQLNIINTKYSQKLRELKEAEAQKVQLQRISSEKEPMQVKYYELEAKYNELLRMGGGENLQQKDRQQYQHQIKILQEEITIMKDRQEQSIIKTQKLSNEQKRLQTFINHGNKQIQTMNSQKQSLIKQNKELKQQLDQISLKVHSNKTEGIKQIQKINSNQIIIQDLKNNLEVQTLKIKQILEDNRLLEVNLNKCEEKNRQLYQDNVQLKSICQGLEHNKNELWGKLKRTTSDRQLVESQKIIKSKQYAVLKKKVQELSSSLEQKQRAILQIDAVRDNYERDYNRIVEQNQEMKARILKLQDDLRKYDQSLGENQQSIYHYQAHLNNLQNENSNLIKKVQKADVEINKLKVEVGRNKSEIQRLQSQLGMLVSSNKEKSKQLQMYEATNNSLKLGINDKLNEINESRSNLQIIKLDNQELDQNCAKLNCEVKRLQGIIVQFERENHSMFDALHMKDSQIQQFQQRMIADKYKQNQYIGEISSLQKQLSLLSSQIHFKDQDFRRTAMERDILKSQMTSNRREPQVEWKSLIQDRLTQTQHQLDIKKREVESHIKQINNLSRVIQEQRMINFKLSKQLQESRYGSNLGTPIRNLVAESMQQSRLENNSINGNFYNQRYHESFESDNTINSKKVMDKLEEIKERYLVTVNAVQNITNKRT